jgi:PAB-dependent poly(A)-specific ribonuclease subunit 2
VIDTVDLYFIKERQRRISLRFLTWFILKQDIQLETHDSIEDARSALLLYKAYQELEEQRAFDDKLEELYRVGREHVRALTSDGLLSTQLRVQNWKPPSATKASPPQMHASPQLSYQPFFPRANVSPTFASAEALQLPFQAFTLDPNFRSPYIPMSPEVVLAPPYVPSRTPIQQASPQSQHQHQHQGGRKGNLHNWGSR